MINDQELLFVVDENNKRIESKPRKEVHTKGYWHRTVHVWFVNGGLQILCQKRSLMKDSNPGKWETCFGGHILEYEGYWTSAINEVEEELGLKLDKGDLIFLKTHKSERDKEFQYIFHVWWKGNLSELKLEKDEIDEVKWFDLEELRKLLTEEKDERWVITDYIVEMLDHIKTSH